MLRTVSTHLELGLSGPSKLVFSLAAAQGLPLQSETLAISVDGQRVEPSELVDAQGSRLHSVVVQGNHLLLDYQAIADGLAEPPKVDEIDQIVYLRPSRYCEADTLGPTAASEFSGLTGTDLLHAVISWVNEQLTYVAGSSLPTDGAVRTLLGRQGVCRDFAHLSIALLRALNVPARLASVYAPGLSPMEFHAVPRRTLTTPGGSWTRPSWPPGRVCSGWRRAGTPPTPPSSPTTGRRPRSTRSR